MNVLVALVCTDFALSLVVVRASCWVFHVLRWACIHAQAAAVLPGCKTIRLPVFVTQGFMALTVVLILMSVVVVRAITVRVWNLQKTSQFRSGCLLVPAKQDGQEHNAAMILTNADRVRVRTVGRALNRIPVVGQNRSCIALLLVWFLALFLGRVCQK